jgi:hypothetical protein
MERFPVPSTSLEAWDYRLDPNYQSPAWDPSGTILFAGSLSKDKNGWLYQNCPSRPRLLLYGNKYVKEINPNKEDDYRGEFAADSPVFHGPISWGLVWEGNSLSRRSGGSHLEYYERFNQPHKLSLYLACGLPVIVWKKAAVADFVETYRCGILVDGLEDIGSQLLKYSRADIVAFRESAIGLSARIRNGYFIGRAVQQVAPFGANLD